MLKCWAGDGVDGCDPTIVTESGQVNFFLAGVKPEPERITEAYTSLDVLPENLFPIKYSLDVALPDRPPEGTLNGFYWLEREGNNSKLMHVM